MDYSFKLKLYQLPDISDFGKLLLYRRKDDRIILKNNSVLPILWDIRNVEDFEEDFVLPRISGIISANDNEIISITYVASKVGVITNKVIIIDVSVLSIFKNDSKA